MKFLALASLVLLLLLQYRLWLGDGGMREVVRLRNEIEVQQQENVTLRERNRTLTAEVQDLKKGTTAIEERARADLGMVRQGETFFQIVPPKGGASRTDSDASTRLAEAAKAYEDVRTRGR
jgi:cell division protein FtsB